jgi:nucleoside-diphosphate-sugar epimerase
MILVTGGTGLVGSELVRQLVAQNRKVRVIYRQQARLEPLLDYIDKVEFFEADILDITLLREAMEGVTQVYHAAAYISFLPGDYERLMKVNVEGTANVVNAMADAGVNRIVYVSSIAAIGGSPGKVITEDTKWEKNPYNTRYGLSKMLAEREIWRGVAEHGLEAVILNPGIILGTGFWEEKNTARLWDAAWKGMPFYTPGTNGYVDVQDVARLMILLMDSNIVNERFIAVAENLSFKELMQQIAATLGKPAPRYAIQKWMAYFIAPADWLSSSLSGGKRRLTLENLRVSLAPFHYSNQKIKDTLGFKFMPISQTIRRITDAYREYKGW